MMRRLFIFLFFLLAVAVHGQLLNPQSKEVTERYYPDPDIEIPTPAFSGDDVEFTDYETMMEYLTPLVDEHSDRATMTFIGESQKGVQIPMITLSKKEVNSDKLHIWMQGSLHGDEPGSTEAMLYLIHEVLTNPEYAHWLDRMEIAVVPMANVDGADMLHRDAANGLDLNRDQTKLMAPESVALKNAFHAFKPHVAVDFHEYRPHRRDFQLFGDFGVNGSYDVMFLYSGNLNVPAVLRNFTKDQFVNAAAKALDEEQLTHHDYFSTRDIRGAVVFSQGSMNARSSATNYALSNVVSTLIEVRGVGLGTTSYKRRVNSAFTVAASYLETAYQKKDEVVRVLDESAQSRGEAVIEIERPLYEASFDVIDNAKRELIQINAAVRDAWKSNALETRARPQAYILPAGNEELVTKLKVLGVEVVTLESATTLQVEQYTIVDYWQDAYTYEEMHRQEVVTSLESVQKTFEAGTAIVLVDQASFNLCMEVLEPETANSFISFGVMKTNMGETLPYFRTVNELPAGVRTNKN